MNFKYRNNSYLKEIEISNFVINGQVILRLSDKFVNYSG